MKALAGPLHSSSRYEHIPSEYKKASPACTTDALEGIYQRPNTRFRLTQATPVEEARSKRSRLAE